MNTNSHPNCPLIWKVTLVCIITGSWIHCNKSLLALYSCLSKVFYNSAARAYKGSVLLTLPYHIWYSWSNWWQNKWICKSHRPWISQAKWSRQLDICTINQSWLHWALSMWSGYQYISSYPGLGHTEFHYYLILNCLCNLGMMAAKIVYRISTEHNAKTEKWLTMDGSMSSGTRLITGTSVSHNISSVSYTGTHELKCHPLLTVIVTVLY